MHSTAEPRLARATRWVCATIVAASAAYFWGTNVADEDLWNHLNFGAMKLRTLTVPQVDAWSYSAPGHAWFNHEWGSEVVFAALYRLGGTPALFALKFGLGLVILGAILDAARTFGRAHDSDDRLDPMLTAAVLVLALAALGPGASFRPQILTMTCLAVEWMLLARADERLWHPAGRAPLGWELGLVPLVILVWTNAHGGFPVGLGLHAAWIAGTVARVVAASTWHEPAPSRRVVLLVLLSGVASLGATLLNPYGLALHRYLATTLGDHGRITEWQAIPLLSTSHLPFKLLAIATIVCAVPWIGARVPRSARLDWRLGFLALALAYALRHQRHSVLFAIVATSMLLAAAERARRRLVTRWPALAPRPPVLAAIGLGALAVSGIQLADVVMRYRGSGLAIRYAREEFPTDAIAFLRAHDIHGNVAAQFEWGGYTLLHLGDAVRVFLDGRYEASYPPQVMDDYFAFVAGEPGWSRVLDAYPTDVVLIDRGSPVIPLLDARPDLVRVYADPTAIVYVRRTPTNLAALARLTAVAGAEPEAARSPTLFP